MGGVLLKWGLSRVSIVLFAGGKGLVTCSRDTPAQLPGALVGLMKVGSSSGALNALRRDARTCTSSSAEELSILDAKLCQGAMQVGRSDRL